MAAVEDDFLFEDEGLDLTEDDKVNSPALTSTRTKFEIENTDKPLDEIEDIDRSLDELVAENTKAPRRYENRSGTFVTGINLFSHDASEKRNKRAQRFGISDAPDKPYDNISIQPQGDDMDTIRKEALHLVGVDDMSTQDIFNYFQIYGPESIEWINDTSCNVVWLDEDSATRALLRMSEDFPKEEKPTSEEQLDEQMDIDDDDSINLEDMEPAGKPSVKKPTPAKKENTSGQTLIYKNELRVAVPHPKSRKLLLRFATRSDKKEKGAQNKSKYYVKHGNPNYRGMKGLISGSLKQKFREGKATVGRNRKPIFKRQLDQEIALEEEEEEREEPSEPTEPLSSIKGRIGVMRSIEPREDSREEPRELPSSIKAWIGVMRSTEPRKESRELPSSIKGRIGVMRSVEPREESREDPREFPSSIKTRIGVKRSASSLASAQEMMEEEGDVEEPQAPPPKKKDKFPRGKMYADQIEEEIKAIRKNTLSNVTVTVNSSAEAAKKPESGNRSAMSKVAMEARLGPRQGLEIEGRMGPRKSTINSDMASRLGPKQSAADINLKAKQDNLVMVVNNESGEMRSKERSKYSGNDGQSSVSDLRSRLKKKNKDAEKGHFSNLPSLSVEVNNSNN